jgi:hypothetical protein
MIFKTAFFNCIITSCKSIWLPLFFLTGLVLPAFCNNNDSTVSVQIKKQHSFNVQEYLQVFYPLQHTAEYWVTICADLPANDNPKCVFKKGEPGHVFLILTKKDPLTAAIITRSFGFYPRLPVSCLLKQVRSKILDNSYREYNAALEKKLTTEEFEMILEKCTELAKNKYNLKKNNCYDYVLKIFNSLPGIEKLPVTKVKFPFIFGRGGSPCGLYTDLKKLSANGSAWAPFIRFGIFQSPGNDSLQNGIALH